MRLPDKSIEEILREIGPKQKSRQVRSLIPVILKIRANEFTWTQTAEILAEHYDLTVCPSTLSQIVRRAMADPDFKIESPDQRRLKEPDFSPLERARTAKEERLKAAKYGPER